MIKGIPAYIDTSAGPQLEGPEGFIVGMYEGKLLRVACPKCSVEMEVMSKTELVQEKPRKHRPTDEVEYLWCMKCNLMFQPPTVLLLPLQ